MKWWSYILFALLLLIIGFGIGYIVFDKEPEFERVVENHIDTLWLMQEKEIDTIKIKEIKYIYETKYDSIIIFNMPDSLLTGYSLQLADSIRERYNSHISE